MTRLGFLALALSVSQAALASPQTPPIHDQDLSGSRGPVRRERVSQKLSPDQLVNLETGVSEIEIELVREHHGELHPLPGLTLTVSSRSGQGSAETAITSDEGSIRLARCEGSQVRVQAALSHSKFSVQGDNGVYQLEFDAACGTRTRAVFLEDSNAGQATGIWEIAQKAHQKLSQFVDMSFWNRPITFVWPGDGDYYQWGSVHITRGDHWDVVGHEMGHAIYDLAQVGGMAGGMHKIDECYGETLALSEGWASYFAAWVSVDLMHPDAQFEHLVPRRAPIRFENVPADVCNGPSNEWRVTAFFWDLIDLHDDGERSQASFTRVWNVLRGSRVSTANHAYSRLKQAGMDSALLEIVWRLSFRTEPPKY